ncbi:hypothetical protein BC937DRAFT_92348 [Endogone sp. FLAS-F59071]|nr:hypothetical protein BC937DRAFT_92348 [Endogone sp. FLAS-F59071]|eukprot:RUS15526.1 hypothetical protein BC937DRAFT_92348 [Endogone sp. FLAS-F59071]
MIHERTKPRYEIADYPCRKCQQDGKTCLKQVTPFESVVCYECSRNRGIMYKANALPNEYHENLVEYVACMCNSFYSEMEFSDMIRDIGTPSDNDPLDSEATNNIDIDSFLLNRGISTDGIDDTSTHLDTTTLPFTPSAFQPAGNISLEFPSSAYLSQDHEMSGINSQDFQVLPPVSPLLSNEPTSSSPARIKTSNGHHHGKPFAEKTHVVKKLTSGKMKCDHCSTKKITCSRTSPCKRCVADGEDCTFHKSRKNNPGTCGECFKRKIRCVGDGAVCYGCKIKFRSPDLCIPVPKKQRRKKDTADQMDLVEASEDEDTRYTYADIVADPSGQQGLPSSNAMPVPSQSALDAELPQKIYINVDALSTDQVLISEAELCRRQAVTDSPLLLAIDAELKKCTQLDVNAVLDLPTDKLSVSAVTKTGMCEFERELEADPIQPLFAVQRFEVLGGFIFLSMSLDWLIVIHFTLSRN